MTTPSRPEHTVEREAIVGATETLDRVFGGDFHYGYTDEGEEITDGLRHITDDYVYGDYIYSFAPIVFMLGSSESIVLPVIDYIKYASEIEGSRFDGEGVCVGEHMAAVYLTSDYEASRRLRIVWSEAKGPRDAEAYQKFEVAAQAAFDAIGDFFDHLRTMNVNKEKVEFLHRSYYRNETYVAPSLQQLLSVAEAKEQANPELENAYARMIQSIHVLVEARGDLTYWTSNHFFPSKTEYNGTYVECYICVGFTLFGATLVREGYDEDFAPAIDDESVYVELRYNNALKPKEVLEITKAYLYEVVSTTGLRLEPSSHYSFEIVNHDEHPEPLDRIPDRLRPLKMGKGLAALYDKFIMANVSEDYEIQILYFTQIVEFVSATVMRMNAIETIGNKLRSGRALQPDAEYILELQDVVERQRERRSDSASVQETIKRCCDAREVLHDAPSYLQKSHSAVLNAEKKGAIEAAEIRALEAFADSLYATRNQIAHAKANYTPRGNECPKDEYDVFVRCARVAADQVIRWYASRSASDRVA